MLEAKKCWAKGFHHNVMGWIQYTSI